VPQRGQAWRSRARMVARMRRHLRVLLDVRKAGSNGGSVALPGAARRMSRRGGSGITPPFPVGVSIRRRPEIDGRRDSGARLSSGYGYSTITRGWGLPGQRTRPLVLRRSGSVCAVEKLLAEPGSLVVVEEALDRAETSQRSRVAPLVDGRTWATGARGSRRSSGQCSSCLRTA